MKIFGKELKFNGFDVFHKGNLPTKTDVGLNAVDNTSDINKPLSNAAKSALGLKANKEDGVPLVIGTQTATTASWTGNVDLDTLVSGTTIRYWLPRTSASGVTLNLTLKGGTTTGAIPCYYGGTTRLTTHYPAGSYINMTYLEGALINGVSYTGWWAQANYVDGTESYAVRWNIAVKAGEPITRYKFLVQAADGRYHPTTIGDTTAATKVVNTIPFLIGSPIIFYSYTTAVAENGLTSSSYNYTAITTSNTAYAFNKSSGWRASEEVYLKGTVSGAFFILDDATPSSHLTQDLPTTDDGFFYMRLGVFTNTTTGFRLNLQHPIYYFKNGELQSLNTSHGAEWSEIIGKPDTFEPSSHTHPTSEIAGLGNIATINKNSSTSNYLRGDGAWVTPPNTVYTHPTGAGNNHIPTGGAVGQILKNTASGTATWQAENVVTNSATNGNIIINGVQSVVYTHPAGTNPHGTTKTDVGLGNVDNTADSTKNVLSATKLTTARTINGVAFDGSANITIADSTKAPLASPSLTGTPTAPTASIGSNTTQIATTAFVQSSLSGAGLGDMLKSVYDTNNNGIVDNAEKVNGYNVNQNLRKTDTVQFSQIGVGTSTPNESVDIVGNARIRSEGSMKFGGTGANDAAFEIKYNNSTNSLDFNFLL